MVLVLSVVKAAVGRCEGGLDSGRKAMSKLFPQSSTEWRSGLHPIVAIVPIPVLDEELFESQFLKNDIEPRPLK